MVLRPASSGRRGRKLNRNFDVVIVGGAVMGSSTAYFLTANPDFDGSVLVVEKDPSYAMAATALSASSIRHQFSNEVNVRMSQFGTRFIKEFSDVMAVDGDRPDLGFQECGYLFLAASEKQAGILRQCHEVQRFCDADVVLWDAAQTKDAFPHLNAEGLLLSSYGRSGEGWFSNTGLMNGFRNKARAQGAHYLTDEVVSIECSAATATAVNLAGGDRIGCGAVVNCSGTRAASVASMANIDLPVEPRKRSIFVFQCADSPQGTAAVNDGCLPLMIDASGVFCRPEGSCFLTGTTPEFDAAADFDDFDPEYEEYDAIWMALAHRSGNFEAIRMVNSWAGHYDYNVLDQNAIVGPHTELRNFFFANGFSGHGLQQSPAIGRGISECIIYGTFTTLDLSPLGYDRIARGEPLQEMAII